MTSTTQVSDTRKRLPRGTFSMLAAAIVIVLFAHSLLARYPGEKQSMTSEARFYCNVKALNPTQRAAHRQLTERLLHARCKTTETPDGYQFQFDASAVSLPDLANWAVAEAKCCPFFNFHLDLENSGNTVGLRLTGPEGVKQFIRLEFAVPAK